MTMLQMLMINLTLYWLFCIVVVLKKVTEENITKHSGSWAIFFGYLIVTTPIYFLIYIW